MKRTLIVLIAFLSAAALQAQSLNTNDTDSLINAFNREISIMKDSFETFHRNAIEEYNKYEAELRAEYEKYESAVKQYWGTDSIVDNTPNEWVEYSNDYKSRSVVDFDSGNISVEVVLDDVDENDPEAVEKKLAEAIEKMLESKGNTNPYNQSKGEELTKDPILDGLVDLSKYNIESTSSSEAEPVSYKKKKTPPSPTVKGKNLNIKDDTAKGDAKKDDMQEILREISAAEKAQLEEARKIADIERVQQEEAKKIAAREKEQQEEAKRIADAERTQQEEARRIAETERKQQEEINRLAQLKKAEELKKKQEEAKKIAELKRKQEAEAKRLAELKKKQEVEAKKLADAKKKQEAEAKRLAELKKKQEAEAKRLADAKKKQEAEAKKLADAKKQQSNTSGKEKKASTKDIAKAVAKQSVKSSSTVKGKDNKTRKVVKVEMALVSDNLSKNAAIYKDYVTKYSNSFDVEEPLIFAIIEQESHFNPEAKSWVPAFGLMQLVPKSGGFDAYRYVYKREWIPTMDYLYVPKQNIELGTAYLRILMNQFRNVKDPACRRLCVIAGYNTGAGNVCRAFTGKTSISGAVEHINKYSYDELYNHLTKKLSTDEARKYVSGVSKKREKYIKK